MPTDEGPFPRFAYRRRITDIREDEASGLITINGELLGYASGLFEKPVYPGEVFQRLVQPGEPAPGTESVMVRVPAASAGLVGAGGSGRLFAAPPSCSGGPIAVDVALPRWSTAVNIAQHVHPNAQDNTQTKIWNSS